MVRWPFHSPPRISSPPSKPPQPDLERSESPVDSARNRPGFSAAIAIARQHLSLRRLASRTIVIPLPRVLRESMSAHVRFTLARLELVASTAGSAAPQSLSPAAPVRAAASEQVESGVVTEALSPSAIPALLSIVIPVYNEEGKRDPLYARLLGVVDLDGVRFGLLFVDDSSKDVTWDVIEKLHAR